MPRDEYVDEFNDFILNEEESALARARRERLAADNRDLTITAQTLQEVLRNEEAPRWEPPPVPQRPTRPQRRTVRANNNLRPGWMDELRRSRQETPMPYRDYDLKDAARNAVITTWDYNTPQYGQHITAAFRFFRNNHSGKYTDTTLMRLDRAAAVYNARTGYDQSYLQEHLPLLATAVLPFEYDEETEVKKGGTVGMMATWKDKAILAVGVGYRRMNVGRTMFTSTINSTGVYPAMWVARTNHEGQHFLLSQGLSPSAMNGNGAIRFDRGSYDD